jgi:hypothetical protein
MRYRRVIPTTAYLRAIALVAELSSHPIARLLST